LNKCDFDKIKKISVRVFSTTVYGIISKKACNGDIIDFIEVELLGAEIMLLFIL